MTEKLCKLTKTLLDLFNDTQFRTSWFLGVSLRFYNSDSSDLAAENNCKEILLKKKAKSFSFGSSFDFLCEFCCVEDTCGEVSGPGGCLYTT